MFDVHQYLVSLSFLLKNDTLEKLCCNHLTLHSWALFLCLRSQYDNGAELFRNDIWISHSIPSEYSLSEMVHFINRRNIFPKGDTHSFIVKYFTWIPMFNDQTYVDSSRAWKKQNHTHYHRCMGDGFDFYWSTINDYGSEWLATTILKKDILEQHWNIHNLEYMMTTNLDLLSL